jgi:hypothetical protein
VRSDGSGFRVLHSFNLYQEGGLPEGSLLLISGTLYGTTLGVIFSLRPDGNDYAVVHPFGIIPEGGLPWYGSLTFSGGVLYGGTLGGGTNNTGTIFSARIHSTGLCTRVAGEVSEEPGTERPSAGMGEQHGLPRSTAIPA